MKKLTSVFLLIGSPNKDADILYFSRFFSSDILAYISVARSKYMIVPRLSVGPAKRLGSGIKILSTDEIRAGDNISFFACVCRFLLTLGAGEVLVKRDFPLGLAKDLEMAGIRTTIIQDELLPRREVKTPDEIQKIKAVQAVAIKAMKKAIQMIACSTPDARGFLRLSGKILSAQGLKREIDMELMQSHCVGEGTIVLCGRDSAQPHGQGHGPLRANELIVMDIFPRSLEHGYWGDITRTVVKGAASEKAEKMYIAVKAAQMAALSEIRADAELKTIHMAAAETLNRHGFQTKITTKKQEGFIHGTGHGLGLEVHESPRVATVSGRLKEGSVITVEPGLYYDNTGGVRIEDLVVVTKTGWRYLGTCGKSMNL